MKAVVNAAPILLILVLGVFGLKGMGNREQSSVTSHQSPVTSEQCNIVDGSVYDADTLKVSCNGAILKVRLACVDSREIKQTGGFQDRDFLRGLISKHGSEVAMIPLEQDRYGRMVAELVLSPGKTPEISVQEELLKSGHARIYTAYSDCPNIEAFKMAEKIGQESKAGVWSEPNPEPPWIWRKRNR